MSDNELDNLFKEAAEGFKVPNDPSAWKAMSGKLDRDSPDGRFWNWKSISITSVIVVVGVALVWYWNSSDEINLLKSQTSIESISSIESSSKNKDQASSLAQQNVVEKNRDQVGDKTQKEVEVFNNEDRPDMSSEANVIVKKSNEATSSPKQKQLQGTEVKTSEKINNGKISEAGQGKSVELNQSEKSRTQQSSISQKTSAAGVVGITGASAENSAVNQKQELSIFSAGIVTGAAVATQTQSVPSNETAGERLSTSDSKITTNDSNPNKGSEVSALASGDSVTKVKDEQLAVADSTQTRGRKKKSKEDRQTSDKIFSIKLAAAPDYTSVENVSPNGWGVSYGMLLEYQFNPHWSVATGAIWSKKIYSAEDVKYNGYTADWVDGDCRMWDIPLNVYYHFTPGRKLSFYAGLGLSSYIMSEENYTFYYETSHGIYDYDSQVKGENNEWFKTMNISLGMQYRINNRFSLQLEPILKAPLAGVGEGEVSLVSLGAFLNLRFDIPLNKKEK